MQKLTVVKGVAAPLMRQNVDTDVIIPMDKMLMGDRDSLGRFAFHAWRRRADGAHDSGLRAQPVCLSRRQDPAGGRQFRLRQLARAGGLGDPRHRHPLRHRTQLRRHLLQQLLRQRHCCRWCCRRTGWRRSPNRRRPRRARCSPSIWSAAGSPRRTARRSPFAVDPRRREALLQGLDEVTLTLRREPEIAAFQAADRRRRPWVYM